MQAELPSSEFYPSVRRIFVSIMNKLPSESVIIDNIAIHAADDDRTDDCGGINTLGKLQLSISSDQHKTAAVTTTTTHRCTPRHTRQTS